MGATNYARENFKEVYSILEDVSDDFDRDDYLNELEYIAEEVKSEFDKNKNINFNFTDGDDGSSNYPGTYFAELEKDGYGIRLKANSGYYQGANLEYEYILNGDVYSSVDDIILDYVDVIGGKERKATITKDIARMVSGVRKVYKRVSKPLEVVGAFSNGVTVYSG